ncbi:DUF3696 domain-containing protein [Paracidovorax oryzae]|uniref:DUF3696 domain-containing protein n=1 Tax=Paracidovorax oryzae TaxID=862720 RepID=UPI0012EBEE4D|nr:DUF3696 domain-containing protein [Paracidovorax oryzae]
MKKESLHSNYQIRWKNYRRFEDTGWITIKPLTILLGANNGGKTSVLSPLLLLSQTNSSNDAEVPLVPFGPLIDLGTYKDFIHQHDTKRDLFLGFRFHSHGEKKNVKSVGAYPPGGVELTFSAGEKPEETLLREVSVTDIYDRPYFSRKYINNSFSLEGVIPLAEMSEEERGAIERVKPENFLFSPNDIFFELQRKEEDKESKAKPFSRHFSHYLRATGFTHSISRAIFGDLSYIGPLRAKLKRFYRVSPELPNTVGAQGEHAAVLFRRRAGELKPTVDKWVQRFEFGTELGYSQLTDDLFQLQFKNGTEETNVADAGFGASQVLPLIVQAAAAPHDSLTLAEQPEIHLNPRLQCVLADLFAEMATSGHRVLVETHSEHLIVRLRRLIAEGKISTKDVALYFVEKKQGISEIRKIPIQENGAIDREEWPHGFFDDGLREALGLATAQAQALTPVRKARKKKSDAPA